MKNKLKKLGVLAVLLANVAIFAPQKAEGQKKTVLFIDNMGDDNREYKYSQMEIPGYLIITCGGDGYGCIPAVQVP
ncbi:MAG: hypothetical protein SFU27_10940 [Thermonemataceae bacterium]|nr:hypothetical protein [Thermonemataceae bacterium]